MTTMKSGKPPIYGALNTPNDPDGWEWKGYFPLAELAHRPPPRQPVVYGLFDANFVCCYIGSTFHLAQRLRQHHNAGKQFVGWKAKPCDSRADAYAIEADLIHRCRPYLNRAGVI